MEYMCARKRLSGRRRKGVAHAHCALQGAIIDAMTLLSMTLRVKPVSVAHQTQADVTET